MTDTRQLAIDLIQQKGYPYWKLYEGNKRIAQCDADENPDGSNEVALTLFLEDIEGRAGKHEINVYKKVRGESGGTKKSFLLESNQNPTRTMFGQTTPTTDLMAIYEQARKDVENQERMKRIEEKLDALLLFIKNANDDDDKNDGQALALIGKLLGGAMSRPGAVPVIPVAPVRNAGLFS